MKNKPMISVVIPVYNGANYLGEAIESVLNQTYKGYEIIVVNDGSEDNGKTRDVALSYGRNIRYFEKKNGGVASALNFGIRQMQGDYFAWLSHDDVFCENKLEDQLQAIFASGKEAAIAMGNYCLCNQDFTESINTEFDRFYPLEQICRSAFLLFWGEVHFSSFLFHKSHFERIGLFREDLLTAQDNDFIFRLLRGQTSVFVKHPVSKVRLHKDSGTSCVKPQVDAENRRLYFKMFQSLSPEERTQIVENEILLAAKIGGIVHSMGGSEEAAEIKEFCDLRKAKRPFLPEAPKETYFIFGAGQYGRRLKYEMDVMGIEVEGFLDNAAEKEGKIIDGIPCYLPRYATQYPEATVIVAQKFYYEAIGQLKDLRIEKVMLKDEMEDYLLEEGM